MQDMHFLANGEAVLIVGFRSSSVDKAVRKRLGPRLRLISREQAKAVEQLGPEVKAVLVLNTLDRASLQKIINFSAGRVIAVVDNKVSLNRRLEMGLKSGFISTPADVLSEYLQPAGHPKYQSRQSAGVDLDCLRLDLSRPKGKKQMTVRAFVRTFWKPPNGRETPTLEVIRAQARQLLPQAGDCGLATSVDTLMRYMLNELSYVPQPETRREF